MVDEFPQAQVPGEGGRQELGHQAMVVKEDADTVGIVRLLGAPFLGGFLFRNHYPRCSFFKGCPQGR